MPLPLPNQVDNAYCEIPLSKGYMAIVDIEDYERVSQFKWTTYGKPPLLYAHRTLSGSKTRISLHRFIMNAMDSQIEIDHLNHNGHDCRKSNMRLATRQQNSGNHRKTTLKTTSSRYKGVSWSKQSNKWRAHIMVNYHKKHLGYFVSENEAAIAYNNAAIEHFKEYACLNIL